MKYFLTALSKETKRRPIILFDEFEIPCHKWEKAECYNKEPHDKYSCSKSSLKTKKVHNDKSIEKFCKFKEDFAKLMNREINLEEFSKLHHEEKEKF